MIRFIHWLERHYLGRQPSAYRQRLCFRIALLRLAYRLPFRSLQRRLFVAVHSMAAPGCVRCCLDDPQGYELPAFHECEPFRCERSRCA